MLPYENQNNPPPKPSPALDYLYIRAWGAYTGSYPYFINLELSEARKTNAPDDAVYQEIPGKWVTVGDLSEDVRRWLNIWLQETKND